MTAQECRIRDEIMATFCKPLIRVTRPLLPSDIEGRIDWFVSGPVQDPVWFQVRGAVLVQLLK